VDSVSWTGTSICLADGSCTSTTRFVIGVSGFGVPGSGVRGVLSTVDFGFRKTGTPVRGLRFRVTI